MVTTKLLLFYKFLGNATISNSVSVKEFEWGCLYYAIKATYRFPFITNFIIEITIIQKSEQKYQINRSVI